MELRVAGSKKGGASGRKKKPELHTETGSYHGMHGEGRMKRPRKRELLNAKRSNQSQKRAYHAATQSWLSAAFLPNCSPSLLDKPTIAALKAEKSRTSESEAIGAK